MASFGAQNAECLSCFNLAFEQSVIWGTNEAVYHHLCPSGFDWYWYVAIALALILTIVLACKIKTKNRTAADGLTIEPQEMENTTTEMRLADFTANVFVPSTEEQTQFKVFYPLAAQLLNERTNLEKFVDELDVNRDGTIDKVELVFALKNFGAFTNTQIVQMTNFLLPRESNSIGSFKALLEQLIDDYNRLNTEKMEDL